MSILRQAFTLFEVMISLLIITIAILSTLMILPVGLRAERLARSELVASSTAITLFDNFHNPLVSFRGHGPLAPDLDHNTNASSPDAPPQPGWAERLRDMNLITSTYQPDFEHELAGWVTGIAPIPLEIARRLDSNGDEIQKILDQGGYLFYMDPNYVRGLTVTSSRDKSQVITPPVESQKLIFAVSGFAQENTLPSHPAESLPWYELYPFPPAWVAMRAHGWEVRHGPMNLVAQVSNQGGVTWGTTDPTTNQMWYFPTQEGRTLNYHKSYAITDQGQGKARGGLEYGDAGFHQDWAPVYFDPAPSNYLQMQLGAGNLDLQANNPIDADDPIEDNPGNPPAAATPGWYQGRNWRYFHQHYPGSPWDLGWVAFQKLAGFNWDVGGSMSQLQYAQTSPGDATIHYERAGWLPVLALLLNKDDPSYDHPWWAQNSATWDNVQQKLVWSGSLGAANQVGGIDPSTITPQNPGGSPFLPGAQPNDVGFSDGTLTDDMIYNGGIGAPNSMPPPPTYEMRASYRDRAIDLWNAVVGNLGSSVYQPKRSTIGSNTPIVDNSQVDCDMYEYGPQELDNFIFTDPSQLPATPHPAQVLALSYLAHAAMMMTGWDVPFASYSAGGRLDWDILTWAAYQPPTGTGSPWPVTVDKNTGLSWNVTPPPPPPPAQAPLPPIFYKDAKIIAPGTTANANQNNVQVKNDTPTDMCFYAGDEICFESDYRDWFRRSVPTGGWQTAASGHTPDRSGFMGPPGDRMLASCRRYRVRNDIYVVAGATGTLVVDPPLVTTLTDTTTSYPDSWANPGYVPPIPLSTPHAQQFIRICNEHDRAFARKVHEMCMEWAARYSADNPYDAGAPRMMNHQVMLDKPLVTLDLFMDAARGPSSDGTAQRTPQNLPTSGSISSTESFYRWMTPSNPQPQSWFAQNHVSGGSVHELSHFGPGRSKFTTWTSLIMNPQLAPPSTGSASASSPWNWSSDDKRYWINRHFNAFHRGRELVFWSVDWQDYEDAETAPSAPMDYAKHARAIWLDPTGKIPQASMRMQFGGDGSQHAGNPENGRVWSSAQRNGRWYDYATAYQQSNYWSYAIDGSDITMGHWGADRNGNRKLDIGPIPASVRLRAETVARFNFYDPILRLNANN